MRAIRAGSTDALTRLRDQHLRWVKVADITAQREREIALHDAQFVIAREQGFASWSKLKAYAEPSFQARRTRIFVADMKWISDRVHGLLQTRSSAGPAALEQIREWHPRFDGCSDEEIRQAPFTEADATCLCAGAWLRLLVRPGAPPPESIDSGFGAGIASGIAPGKDRRMDLWIPGNRQMVSSI